MKNMETSLKTTVCCTRKRDRVQQRKYETSARRQGYFVPTRSEGTSDESNSWPIFLQLI